MFLVVLIIFFVLVSGITRLLSGRPTPTRTPVPVPTAEPAVTGWTALDDRQLTRLLKSAAP